MRISDWSSDVCSSDLIGPRDDHDRNARAAGERPFEGQDIVAIARRQGGEPREIGIIDRRARASRGVGGHGDTHRLSLPSRAPHRSEEHTSELQSLMRSSYAVSCLKKIKIN